MKANLTVFKKNQSLKKVFIKANLTVIKRNQLLKKAFIKVKKWIR